VIEQFNNMVDYVAVLLQILGALVHILIILTEVLVDRCLDSSSN